MGKLKIPHATDAERTTFTPEESEILYVTDTKKLYLGDGSTAGGVAADADVPGVIPAGGGTNEVLSKASAADYDVQWSAAAGGGGAWGGISGDINDQPDLVDLLFNGGRYWGYSIDFDATTVNRVPFILQALAGGANTLWPSQAAVGRPGVTAIVAGALADSGYGYQLTPNAYWCQGGESAKMVARVPSTFISRNGELFLGFMNKTSAAGSPTRGIWLQIYVDTGVLKVRGSWGDGTTTTHTAAEYTLDNLLWYSIDFVTANDLSSVTFNVYNEDRTTLLWTETITADMTGASGAAVTPGLIGYVVDSGVSGAVTYLDYFGVWCRKPLAR